MLKMIARSTKASYETPTRINRRVIVGEDEVVARIASGYWGLYLPTSPAQAAAGNTNAVNTHRVRLNLMATR